MKFIGIDLAWAEQNPSGVAWIDSEGILVDASSDLKTNEAICEFAGIAGGTDAVITIDAPLIVKNADGRRPVEDRLHEIFGQYDAGPYPANLSNPAFQASGRIQRLVKLLEQLGFEQRPRIPKQQPQRSFLEVFPAPAQVVLFPCMTRNAHTHCRPPKYKYNAKRSWDKVQCEWEIYRARLLSLRVKEPALKFSPEVKQALAVDVEGCTGARYKRLDDLLDGIFCAYLAYYFWYWGEERCWVAGDLDSGCITLPRCAELSIAHTTDQGSCVIGATEV